MPVTVPAAQLTHGWARPRCHPRIGLTSACEVDRHIGALRRRIAGAVEDAVLVCRDNGPGIEAEHLDKIFDPFFTTKEVGQGMGLGLAICYRIIQDYDGRITVRTEPGRFCEFTLEFPMKG